MYILENTGKFYIRYFHLNYEEVIEFVFKGTIMDLSHLHIKMMLTRLSSTVMMIQSCLDMICASGDVELSAK